MKRFLPLLGAAIVGSLLTLGGVHLMAQKNIPTVSQAPATTNDKYEKYYADFGAYTYLLDSTEYDKVQDSISKIGEDKEFEKQITLMAMKLLFDKDPSIRASLEQVMDKVELAKTEDKFFEKNTSCAALAPGIKSSLTSKSSFYGQITNEFEYIFYSPTLDTCIYTVHRTEPGDDFTSTHYKDVFNANTQSLIEGYRVNSSEDYDDDSEESRSKQGTRNYIKYILENSNYNVDLLRDTSYIYF